MKICKFPLFSGVRMHECTPRWTKKAFRGCAGVLTKVQQHRGRWIIFHQLQLCHKGFRVDFSPPLTFFHHKREGFVGVSLQRTHWTHRNYQGRKEKLSVNHGAFHDDTCEVSSAIPRPETSRLEMFPFCQLEYWLAMGIPPRLMGFLKQLDSDISHLHQETKQNKRIAKACPTIPCEIWLLRRMSTCHSIAEKISKTCTYHCLTRCIWFRPCMKGTTRVLP